LQNNIQIFFTVIMLEVVPYSKSDRDILCKIFVPNLLLP
jgi:hypothetical protein